MIIRSLRLKNIRSYTDETIEFPEGALLLSGDIGSGKSTILLALEFALFGIMKGLQPASTLLRHGEKSGSVELSFSLGEKEISIKRTLKRASTGILQDSGSLVVNGHSFEGSSQEIKARILALLGYPEALLNKSKSLIFRYTVFTPQEEMKRILLESREERLDILRRLFDIDKYKRAKENSGLVLRELKNKTAVLSGKLEGLFEKRKEKERYALDIARETAALKESEELHKKFQEEFSQRNADEKKLEAELDELLRIDKAVAIKRNEQRSLLSQAERAEKDLVRIEGDKERLRKELGGFDLTKEEVMAKRLLEKQDQVKKIDERLREFSEKRAENLAAKRASEKIVKEIASLDKCPTCMQTVTPEHASGVTAKEQVVITRCEANLGLLDTLERQLKERRAVAEEEISLCQKGERELSAKKVYARNLAESTERGQALQRELLMIKEKIENNSAELESLGKRLDLLAEKREALLLSKKAVEDAREKSAKVERAMIEARTTISNYTRIEKRLAEEITRLADDEKLLLKTANTASWLSDTFIPALDTIETQVLSRIYSEFNSYFQDWFNTLIEDEMISVRLDEYFAPVIEQNGYESFLENLSGGEKTSVALAYRLALNKVINDFLSTINTRDLIILDEPTDGFSSEQLDRVREVLSQLNTKQTIIVSHEPKMESFVDNIIRIKKRGHVSSVGA